MPFSPVQSALRARLVTLVATLGLLLLGLIAIWDYTSQRNGYFNAYPPGFLVTRQLINIAIGLVLMVVMSLISHWITKAKPAICLGVFGLLVLAPSAITGTDSLHLSLGPVNLNPGLCAVLLMLPALAWILTRIEDEPAILWHRAALVLLLACSSALFVLARSLDMAFLICALVMLLQLATVMSERHGRITPATIAHLLTPLAIFTIFAALQGPDALIRRFNSYAFTNDPSGAGYETLNALMCIRSGGVTGLGFGSFSQTGPVHFSSITTMVLKVIGREMGSLGIGLIVALVSAFIWGAATIVKACGDRAEVRQLKRVALLFMAIPMIVSIMRAFNVVPFLPSFVFSFVSYGATGIFVNSIALGMLLGFARSSISIGQVNDIDGGHETLRDTQRRRQVVFAMVLLGGAVVFQAARQIYMVSPPRLPEAVVPAFYERSRLLDRSGTILPYDAEEDMLFGRRSGDIPLTIDLPLQQAAERELSLTAAYTGAKGGQCIVMDVINGEILAYATYPNRCMAADGRKAVVASANYALSTVMEPGAVFDIVPAIAALEEGIAKDGKTIVQCTGTIRVANRDIHDVQHGHNQVDLRRYLTDSCNIAGATLTTRLGARRILSWSRILGFGRHTGVGLPGEANGIVEKKSLQYPHTLASVGFGQGVAVTPLQLVAAYAAVANDGTYIAPRIVQDAELSKRQVFKPVTAELLSGYLSDAVENGTGSEAKIRGYRVAGKTGTAQKSTPGKGYVEGLCVASFVGFLPVEKPRVAIVVAVDEPKAPATGGTVAAPIFRRVGLKAMKRLKVKQYN